MKEHLKTDMAIDLMLGKIQVKRNDPYYLIHAISIVRKRKREIMEFFNDLSEEDKLLFKDDLRNYNNAIDYYKPNMV